MSIPTWLSVATYNRLDGSYINDSLDCSGNIICRGSNSLWLDTNTSIKLNNAGTVTTLSRDELSYLDGVTSSIQTQINGKATTGDVTTLQTKTQNITATSVLTTIEDNVTLSTGNLSLTNGDLTIASTKSIICDGELKLGLTGRISGTGLTISNAQLIYLNGLTASVETRIANNTTAIETNTSNIATLTTKATGITYNSTFNRTEIDHDLKLVGSVLFSKGLFIENTTFDGLISLSSTATTSNCIISSLPTAGVTSTKQLAGDAIIQSSGPLIFCVNPSNTQSTGLRLTETQLQLNCDILSNSQTITPTNLGRVSGLTSNAQTQLTALQDKTVNMTNATGGATTLYQNTHNFSSTTTLQMLSGSFLNINGTARILLNGTSSYLDMGTSLGILTTAGVYINATEMSMLNGATVNIPTAITNINTSLTDLQTKTTNISYDVPTLTTTISGIVNFTGTTKTSGQAWMDAGIKLKTTYVAPVTGELGFTTTSNLASQITTFVNSTGKNIVSFTLPIGVWLMTYNVLTNLTGGTFSSIFIGVTTTSNGLAASLVSQITQPNIPYTGEIRFSTSRVINVSASTTYYLTGFFSFTGTSPAVNTPTYLEATRIA